MPLLRIRDRNFAVGCSWHPVESAHPPLREIRRIAGSSPRVVVPSRDGSMPMIGLAPDVPPGTPTLAGSLATASGSGIYLLPMIDEPGNIWACAVTNGSVLNGFDMVGPRELVMEELRDLLAMHGEEGSTIPIRADYGAFPDEGDFGGTVEALSDISAFLTFEQLVVLDIDRSRRRMLLMLALLLSIGTAAVAATWIWTHKTRIERAMGPTPEELESQHRADWRRGLVRALSGMERFSAWPMEAADAMWALAAFEGTAYWHYKGADCAAAGCSSLWEGGERSLVAMLADRLGTDVRGLALDPQGRRLTLRHPGNKRAPVMRVVHDGDLEKLPLLSEVQVRWHDALALALQEAPRLRAEAMASPRTVSPIGVDPQKKPKAVMPELLAGTANLSGSEMSTLPVALRIAQHMDMTPKRLLVTPPGATATDKSLWRVELEYVARR